MNGDGRRLYGEILTYPEQGLDLGDAILRGLGSLFAEIGPEILLELIVCFLDALWTV